MNSVNLNFHYNVDAFIITLGNRVCQVIGFLEMLIQVCQLTTSTISLWDKFPTKNIVPLSRYFLLISYDPGEKEKDQEFE